LKDDSIETGVLEIDRLEKELKLKREASKDETEFVT